MRLFGIVVILLFTSCSGNNQGFEELGEGQFFKLQKFGDSSAEIPAKNVREIVFQVADGNISYRDTFFFRNLNAEVIGQGEWTNKLLSLKEGDSASFKLLSKYLNSSLLTAKKFNNDTVYLDVLIAQLRAEEEYLQRVNQKLQAGDLREQVIFLKQEMELRGLSDEYTMYKGGFYKMIQTQDDSIRLGAEVCLNYTGTLLDGTVFDQSPDGGLCYIIGQQNQVISGLDMMARRACNGDSLQIYLPPYLAFGERGVGNVLPPFAMVIYNVGFHKSDTIPL